ncbi:uncharacterized protein LOC110901786 [Helianthus annuus]|uniref:uncharacterized protein LOC110901786 n=1 Tax=Helianthus annuus TaxID=4232 RepID=UPI000B8F3419|nr:uncharacterized protein LOC110901786 [Helianthus annuus]
MRGDHQYPTVMLEADASQDLWYWLAFCGPLGSNNDVNVLHQSPIFDYVRNGTAPNSSFYVNDQFYKRGYYLTDEIYPAWSTFVNVFRYPTDPKEKKRLTKVQESARKDVERSFGALKGKRGTLRRPLRSTTVGKIRGIVYACMILHKMILKDEGRAISLVHIRDQPVEPAFNI